MNNHSSLLDTTFEEEEEPTQQDAPFDSRDEAVWGRLILLTPQDELDEDVRTNLPRIVDLRGNKEITLGRGKDCDPRTVFPTNRRISAKHAQIYRDAESHQIFLADLSSNGTSVNGIKVGKGSRVAVKGGDHITLCSGEGKCDNIIVILAGMGLRLEKMV